jgi:hypothetical protein
VTSPVHFFLSISRIFVHVLHNLSGGIGHAVSTCALLLEKSHCIYTAQQFIFRKQYYNQKVLTRLSIKCGPTRSLLVFHCMHVPKTWDVNHFALLLANFPVSKDEKSLCFGRDYV